MKLVLTFSIENFPDDGEHLIPQGFDLVPHWDTTEMRYAWDGLVMTVNDEDQPSEDLYLAQFWGEWPTRDKVTT